MSTIAVPHASASRSRLAPAIAIPGSHRTGFIDDIDDTTVERWVRRAVIALATIALVVMALAAVRILGAHSESQAVTASVAGHVVAEPGMALSDIATRTLPVGADPEAYRAAMEAINVHHDGSASTHWRVVLLPVSGR